MADLDTAGRRRPADLEQGDGSSVLDVLGLPDPNGSPTAVQSSRKFAERAGAAAGLVGVGTGGVGLLVKVFAENAGGTANRLMIAGGAALAAGTMVNGGSQAILGSSENAVVDARPGGRIVGVLKNVIASAPPERQQAVRDHLASKWESLRSRFQSLSSTNAAARDRGAAALARNRALNAAVVADACRPDIADVLGLIEDMKDILNQAQDESPLTDRQYVDVCARLAQLAQAPSPALQAFWLLQSSTAANEPPDGASPQFRFATALLQEAGCDYGSIKDALVLAEAQSGAAVTTEARTASPTASEAADIGQQLPPYSPRTSDSNEPLPSYPPPTTAR